MSHNPSHGDHDTEADDLTRIGGIGSKIAEKLIAAGIRTFADLASRPADDIAKLLPDVSGLPTARLDSWRDQARELAATTPVTAAETAAPEARAPEAGAPEIPPDAPDNGQHYESFVIRVVLNEDGSIRRTTAQHIRTGTERHWPGLQHEALSSFIETAVASVPQSAEAGSESLRDHVRQAGVAATPPARLQPAPPQPAPPPGVPAGARRAGRASSAVVSVERIPLRALEPFSMTIAIDLADPASHSDPLAYSAVVVARPLTGGPKRTVARSEGLIALTSPIITIDATGLPPGAYRIDGAVSLRQPGSDRPVDLAGLAEGLLVQVLPG